MKRTLMTAGPRWLPAEGTKNALSMTERFAELRKILREATDFRKPWDYFHDELVLDPAFMQLGHPQESPRLAQVLSVIGSKLLGGKLVPQGIMLFYLKDMAFWHGTCSLGDRVAVCFHFEDVDQGLVGIMKDLISSEVLLARLSVLEMPKGVISVGRGGTA
jgi:hypothetical protein